MEAPSLSPKVKPPPSASWARVPKTVFRAALELVFPATCVSCGAEMGGDTKAEFELPLCAACLSQLPLFTGPTCRQCGARVPDTTAAPNCCRRCRGRKLWFDETIALGEYVGRLRQLLLHMKRARGDATSLALGNLLWHRWGDRLEAPRPDVVVPVPMHWRRQWVHGTNSAVLLGEVLARRMHAPLAARLLRRRRNTPPQISLPPSQRWPNVRRAFSVRRGYPLRGSHVLLVDDILTTGATCSEASRTLKAAGAGRVSVVVVARTLTH